MSCIDVNHLSKLYGSVKAVDDVELLVERGQVFGFLGPNGAGKSTIIKLLTTLIPPSSGTLSILGIDAVKNPLQVRHKIGVVLQQPSYEPTLSVEKSLDKYGMMWNVPRVERKKRLEHLLKDFDLVEIRKKRTEDLSIGQRRRVQVAREFMHDMDLLFLDEPTVGLDPNARRKLLDYLKNKVKTGLTIFYTTHILTEAEYLCDKIAIIDKGKIIAVDSPNALKTRFGKEKTIEIHLLEKKSEITSLLSKIPDCKINFNTGTKIIIHSEQSELVLLQVLKILNDNCLEIEDLSAVPTNLEDIFLKMVRENASNN
jgi:ABC-2 type transport system ATP-binding protein